LQVLAQVQVVQFCLQLQQMLLHQPPLQILSYLQIPLAQPPTVQVDQLLLQHQAQVLQPF
jgi:hypothetical protein